MKKYMFLVLLVGFSFFMSGCKDKYDTKREFRGVWLSRFDFARGDTDPEIMKNRISNAMKNVNHGHINAKVYLIGPQYETVIPVNHIIISSTILSITKYALINVNTYVKKVFLSVLMTFKNLSKYFNIKSTKNPPNFIYLYTIIIL